MLGNISICPVAVIDFITACKNRGEHMLLLYQLLVWLTVLGLGLYVFASWRWEEETKKRLPIIRRLWYAWFVAGAAFTWTFYPESIFTEWNHYLIVALLFVVVDAFVF